MAQADSESIMKDGDVLDKREDGSPPTKKLRQLDLKQMKQGRIPFKRVDVKSTGMGSSPTCSKKRKLSDSESQSSKLSKTPKTQTKTVIEINEVEISSKSPKSQAKTAEEINESEVSSSSEADHQTKRSRIRNTLERFVCKASQEEISSTNDGIDSMEQKSAKSPICIESDESDDEKENIPKGASVEKVTPVGGQKKPAEDGVTEIASSGSVDEVSPVGGQKEPAEEASSSVEEGSPVAGQKEPAEDEVMEIDSESAKDKKLEEGLESSSISPVCGTPSKGKVSDTLLKTPTSKLSDSVSDISCSDSTPNTAKRAPRKLSDAKRKEREASRQKFKEEKEKLLQEKRQKKEQERLDKEREKERLKKEREEAKAEKERQKQDEKEKKEKERQEKLAQKEEEKKKKQEMLEAKLEEKKKKEEEKRLKEEEKQKEEEEKKQKEQKLKKSFTSFFIKPKTSPSAKSTREPVGMFMPFEIKKDMFLAPQRRGLDLTSKEKLDQCLKNQDDGRDLYLSELKTRNIKLIKHRGTQDREEEVILVHDSETVKSITYHCKLLQFHMNYRPPYYGTWRKKSGKLSPRNPFKMDSGLFDYEVDSDDEWEEEEPGESLSASEGEEEENNEDEEEEDAGWMVPHGYLSEGEGCEDEEEEGADLKLRCMKKLEQWEMELKRQTQPALPVIIGCFWEHAVHELQKDLQEKLASYKAVPLMDEPIDTSFTGDKSRRGDNTPSEKKEDSKKTQCKPVPEEAMPDLIRLVHGNLAGIKRLVKEFRLYWKNKTKEKQMEVGNDTDEKMDVDENNKRTDESKHLDDSDLKDETKQVTEVLTEDEFSISKRQLEIRITSIAVREKRDSYKKICWYVNDAVLEQYNMKDLPVPSAWELLSQPKKTPIKPKMEEQVNAGRKTPTVSITQFARPMSPSAIQAQFAAANAAALANKQKAVAEQATKVSELPEQKSSIQSKEDGKSDQPKLNFFSPSKPHQWKMVNSGSSVKDGKRLVLVSTQPSSGKNIPDQDKGQPNSVPNPSSKTIQSSQPSLSPASTASQEDEKNTGMKMVVDLQTTGENSSEAIVLD